MALAGISISRYGVDIALVSARDGQLQALENHPIGFIDPALSGPNELLISTIKSLFEKYPRENVLIKSQSGQAS